MDDQRLIEVWKVLETLTVSLARIGSFFSRTWSGCSDARPVCVRRRWPVSRGVHRKNDAPRSVVEERRRDRRSIGKDCGVVIAPLLASTRRSRLAFRFPEHGLVVPDVLVALSIEDEPVSGRKREVGHDEVEQSGKVVYAQWSIEIRVAAPMLATPDVPAVRAVRGA